MKWDLDMYLPPEVFGLMLTLGSFIVICRVNVIYLKGVSSRLL
jgi:hypothetical protein